jgi:hypothetical protein
MPIEVVFPVTINSSTASDGTANLSLESLTVGGNIEFSGSGSLFFGEPLTYTYEGFAASNHREALKTKGNEVSQITVNTATYNLVPPSSEGLNVGDMVEYHITASGVEVALSLDSGIFLPSDSGVAFPKILTNGYTYIVALKWSGGFWWLVSLVGGYGT